MPQTLGIAKREPLTSALQSLGIPKREPFSSIGLITAGNIDLFKQPSVPNPKGGRSTVQSFSVNLDGQEVLLPTVMPDGRLLSEDDALKEYKKTGRHLGIFADPESATAYAKQLHEDYAAGKYRPKPMKADAFTDPASVKITPSRSALQLTAPLMQVEEPRPSRLGKARTSDIELKPEPAVEPATFLGRLSDLGISAVKGAIGLPATAVGLADIPTGGRVGKALEVVGFKPAEARAILDTYYTEQQQRANRKVAEAKGLVDTAVTALRNPSTILQGVVESAPSMIGAGGVARAMVKVGVPAVAAAAAGEGLVSAGQQAEQSREQSETGTITAKQSALAVAAGAGTSLIGAFGNKIAKALGIADVDTMLAGAVKDASARQNLVKTLVYGSVQEGFLEEFPQSVQEQVLQNIAAGKPWEQGVSQAGVMGALAGGVMGGGAQVASRVVERARPVPGAPVKATAAEPLAIASVEPLASPKAVEPPLSVVQPEMTQAERNALAKAEVSAEPPARMQPEWIAAGRQVERRVREGISPTGEERRAPETALVPSQLAKLNSDQLMAALDDAAGRGLIKAWAPSDLSADGELLEVGVQQNNGDWIHIGRELPQPTGEERRTPAITVYRGGTTPDGWWTPNERAAKEYAALSEGGAVTSRTLAVKNPAKAADVLASAQALGLVDQRDPRPAYHYVQEETFGDDAAKVKADLHRRGFDAIHLAEGEDFAPSGQAIESWYPLTDETVKASKYGERRSFPSTVTEVSPPKKEREDHPFSSTQVNLPAELATKIREMALQIPDEDIAPDGRAGDSEGTAPHATVKYGLHTNDVEKVREVLQDEPPIRVTLGATSFFPNGESGSGDVLKFDVDSPDLHRLNAKIAEALEVTDTYPDYKPHVTVAYLKPGKGKQYEGDESLRGQTVTIDTLRFSTKEGRIFEIPLTGRYPELDTAAGREEDTGSGPEPEGSETPSEARSPSLDRVAASVPTRLESHKGREARRRSHYRDVFRHVLTRAQAVDPSVNRNQIKAEFDHRIALIEDLDTQFRESGHSPRALLEAIAKAGGISVAAEEGGGYSGELRWVRESPATGPYGNFAGVPNVFRMRAGTGAASQRTGLSLDEMATYLSRNDARFAHIEGPNELLAALEDVSRMGDVGSRGAIYPGSDELAKRAGMQPGEKWWEDSWRQAPEQATEPEPLTAESYQKAFGGTPEQAEAIVKVYEAMGIPLDRVFVAKGGAVGELSQEERQTGTPAFRRWFGDSKVVNTAGQPLVVYHGTKDDVVAFDLQHPHRKDTGWLGTGIYMTTDPNLAGSYAMLKGGSAGDRTIPLYARLVNPFYATQRDKERFMLLAQREGRVAARVAADEWTERLKAKGHDGVILDYTADQVGEKNASREIVVFDPAGVKSAIGNRGTFDPTNQSILYQDAVEPAPIFYSRLSQVVSEKMPNRASAKQILDIVSHPKNGVKAEELQWSGLKEWLAQREGATKAEVTAFLEANQIQVKEVILGEHGELNVEAEIALIQAEGFDVQADGDDDDPPYLAWNGQPVEMADDGAWIDGPRPFVPRRVREAFHRVEAKDDAFTGGRTKFETSVLPGGEEYRELLLTLPWKAETDVPMEWAKNLDGKWAWFQNAVQISGAFPNESDSAAAKQTLSRATRGTANFTGGHYDEPNVLAHIRFNDRTDAQGRKVLFVEEVQSDWHQKGRKHGYAEPEKPHKVPDAPFKTTWPELAMKRMLRYAAEHGYDVLAWTTGTQQNERYDLSKQIKEVFAVKVGEDQFDLTVTGNDNQAVYDTARTGSISIAKVEELIGKEMAEKIQKQDAKSPITYEGLDLKVGGKGMKGFYDDILPRFMDRYGKAWGVHTHDVDVETGKKTRDAHAGPYHTTAELYALAEDQKRVDLQQLISSIARRMERGYNYSDAVEEAVENEGYDGPGRNNVRTLLDVIGGRMVPGARRELSKVHGILVTEKARDSVLRGQPLFQGPKASVEFTEHGEAVIRALKNPDVSSGLHEAAHVARRFLFDRSLPQDVREGISDEDILTAETWAGAKDGTWDRDAEEKFARGFERYFHDGEAPSASLKALFERFAAWLGRIYRTIIGSPIDVEISPAMKQVYDTLMTRGERLEAAGSFDVEALERELAGAGEDVLYQGDPSLPLTGTKADRLDTGDEQPRLPGAESVRDTDTKTPEFDAPFSLTGEVSKAKKGRQDTLFQAGGPPQKRGTKDITLEQLADVASRRKLPLERVRQVAEQAGYTVVDEGPRPVRTDSGREIPPAKPIPPEKVLEFPSIQKMPAAIRGDVEALLQRYQGFQEQRRGVQSWDRTTELSKDTWLPLETLRPGKALNAEELRAYQTAIATSLSMRKPLLEKITDGTASDWDRLQVAHLTDVATVLTASYRGAKAEAGRALNILRAQARVLDLRESRFLEAALKAPGFAGDLTALSKAALEAAGDPLKQLQLLRQRTAGTWFDVVQAVYYANILSGIKTHERNIIGNSFNVLANMITPVGAVPVDVVRSIRRGQPRTVFLGELPHQFAGTFIGVNQGTRNAAFTFSQGFRPSTVRAAGEGKFDTPRYELPGGLKNPFNYPGRALEAADEFFRAVAYSQELYAGTYAAVRAEGRRDGQEIAKRMAELLAATDPTTRDGQAFEQIQERAATFTARAVFQEEPGAIVKWLLKAKAPTSPLPLRAASLFLSPFIKTPAAIMRQGAEWSPLGFVMKEAKKDGREGSQGAGRAALGTAFILGPIAWLAATGRLTGAPPDDPGDREEFYAQGKLANAVRIGDYWVRYVLFQPFSIPMAAVANAWDKFQASEQDEKSAEEALTSAVAGAGASLLDQSFLAGIGTFIDAVNDPTRYAGQWRTLLAQGFVPFSGLLRNITQATDATVRKPVGTVEGVESIVPGLSGQLPPRRTRFGEPVARPGGALQRGFVVPEVSKVVDDDVTRTLAALKVHPITPRAELTIRGTQVELSRADQDVMVEALGRERKVAIETAIQSAGFARRDDEIKVEVLERAMSTASRTVHARATRAYLQKQSFTVERLVSSRVTEAMRRDQDALFGAQDRTRAAAR